MKHTIRYTLSVLVFALVFALVGGAPVAQAGCPVKAGKSIASDAKKEFDDIEALIAEYKKAQGGLVAAAAPASESNTVVLTEPGTGTTFTPGAAPEKPRALTADEKARMAKVKINTSLAAPKGVLP